MKMFWIHMNYAAGKGKVWYLVDVTNFDLGENGGDTGIWGKYIEWGKRLNTKKTINHKLWRAGGFFKFDKMISMKPR